jgi:hypothetical protein
MILGRVGHKHRQGVTVLAPSSAIQFLLLCPHKTHHTRAQIINERFCPSRAKSQNQKGLRCYMIIKFLCVIDRHIPDALGICHE